MINISVDMGRFTLSGDGENIKEAMKALSQSGGLEFLADKCCGVCKGEDIIPRHRISTDAKGIKKYDYFEICCTKPGCWARLALGVSTDNFGLFPKRKDSEGNKLPNNGWEKYTKPTE